MGKISLFYVFFAASLLFCTNVFAQSANSGTEKTFCILDGKSAALRIDSDGSIHLKHKRAGNTFSQPAPQYKVSNMKKNGDCVEFDIAYEEFPVRVKIKLCEDSSFEMSINADPNATMKKHLHFPPAWKMEKNDTGIYPLGTGYAFPVSMQNMPINAKTACCSGANWSMALTAVERGNSVLICAIDTQCDAYIKNEYVDSLMHTSVFWISQKDKFGYERRLKILVGDGLVDAMDKYRNWRKSQGFVRTLKQKAQKLPSLEKLRGAADIWLWDDNSTNKLYARPENPNAPKRDVRKIAKEMKALGMNKVLWNNFEGESREDCIFLKNLGYLVGKYDIYRDVLPKPLVDKIIAIRVKRSVNTKYWPDIVRIGKHGDMAQAWQVHGLDGKLYPQHSVCEICAYELTKKNVSADIAKVPYDARLIDVQAQSTPVECYSDKHPATRRESFANIRLQQQYLADIGLVQGVECGQEYFAATYDYAEGLLCPYKFRIPDAGRRMTDCLKRDELNPEMEAFMFNPKYRIPLWELAYHDCVVNYWYWGVSNAICPEIMYKFDIFDALYGYPPIYSIDVSHWNLLKEKIAASYKKVSPVAELVGFERMTNFEYLRPDKLVQKTTYENGVSVVANFSESDFVLPDNRTVKPWSFEVVKN